MRKVITSFFLFFLALSVYAQKHELGVFVGGANAISDIGSTNYINVLPRKVMGKLKIPFAVGGIYRYNLNPQQGLRFSLSYASIADDNGQATEGYRKYRKDNSYATYYKNTNYSNSIFEFSTVFEYNFFPINSEQQSASSPYIYGGLGIFSADALYYKVIKIDSVNNNVDVLKKTKIGFSIPFGVGYKFKFNWNWVLGAEIGFRPTFFNSLDLGTITKDDIEYYKREGGKQVKITKKEDREPIEKWFKEDYTPKREVGSTKNDWYVFTGLTLTYTFGRPPCFCD